MVLEPVLEPHFHPDSYGYRPGKSAIQALGVARKRCWRSHWVLDLDIKGFFDNIDHALLLRALRKHTACPWVLLYVARWLQAPVQGQDGTLVQRGRGVPQGGCISPVLANLFGRLFGRKGTVSLMTPCVDGNVRPHSGVSSGQARCWWSASRGQRDLCVGRRPTRSRRAGQDQKGKP